MSTYWDGPGSRQPSHGVTRTTNPPTQHSAQESTMKRIAAVAIATSTLFVPAVAHAQDAPVATLSSTVSLHSYVELDLHFAQGVPSNHVVVATAYAGVCRPKHCTYYQFRLVPDTADGKAWTDTEVVNAPGHYRITSITDWTNKKVVRKVAVDTRFGITPN